MSLSNKEWVIEDTVDSVDLNGQFEGKKDSQVAGETINGATLPVPVYFDPADAEWYACDGNVQTKLEFTGFAITNSTNGNPIDIQFEGIVSGFSGLTVGARYYVQDAVGTIGTSIGTYEVQVGIAVSATELFIQQGNFEFIGSGSASGNKNVTITVTSPAIARFAIISFSISRYLDVNYTTHLYGSTFLCRRGMTGSSHSDDWYSPPSYTSGSFGWSSETISGVPDNADTYLSMTVNFYK